MAISVFDRYVRDYYNERARRVPGRPGSSRARAALTRGVSNVAHHELSQCGMLPQTVVVIGGGLAGCEAAWQAAERGARVQLYEMRPFRMTPAHRTDRLAELVCSNSLGSKRPDRALGLLKNELRRLGSLADRSCRFDVGASRRCARRRKGRIQPGGDCGNRRAPAHRGRPEGGDSHS